MVDVQSATPAPLTIGSTPSSSSLLLSPSTTSTATTASGHATSSLQIQPPSTPTPGTSANTAIRAELQGQLDRATLTVAEIKQNSRGY
jgi:hypothetical protein